MPRGSYRTKTVKLERARCSNVEKLNKCHMQNHSHQNPLLFPKSTVIHPGLRSPHWPSCFETAPMICYLWQFQSDVKRDGLLRAASRFGPCGTSFLLSQYLRIGFYFKRSGFFQESFLKFASSQVSSFCFPGLYSDKGTLKEKEFIRLTILGCSL